jgi:hypothetical protein
VVHDQLATTTNTALRVEAELKKHPGPAPERLESYIKFFEAPEQIASVINILQENGHFTLPMAYEHLAHKKMEEEQKKNIADSP